jgi:hypothetical protein
MLELKLKKGKQHLVKKICIEKYGEEEGLKRWNERQGKWKKSISNSLFDTSTKDSKSIDFFKKNGDNWISDAIDNCTFKNKELLKRLISESENLDDFITKLCTELSIETIRKFDDIIKSKIILNYYNTDLIYAKERFSEIFGVISTKYGSYRYFNGHICRSNGEYFIAKKLKDNNIEYVYEKKYPNSNFICDFYIPKYDLYIEYLGFLKNDDFINDMTFSYTKKYKEKEEYCKRSNLNYFFSNDKNKIIEKIWQIN